jgi:hypothetical protein
MFHLVLILCPQTALNRYLDSESTKLKMSQQFHHYFIENKKCAPRKGSTSFMRKSDRYKHPWERCSDENYTERGKTVKLDRAF